MRTLKLYHIVIFVIIVLVISLSWLARIDGGEPVATDAGQPAATGPDAKALAFLNTMMDRYHRTFDVYTDLGAAGNHFQVLGYMPDETAPIEMDTGWTKNLPHGATCIKCSFDPGKGPWGGVFFLNGTLQGDDRVPSPNWGAIKNAGFNLTGAKRITFRAKGLKGQEHVEFFVGGVGWDVDYRGMSIAPKKGFMAETLKKTAHTIREVTLTPDWASYSIEFTENDNLQYMLGRFGWVANDQKNKDNITFFLDDIRWEADKDDSTKFTQRRLDSPRFLLSYDAGNANTDADIVSRNTAWTYDNALALLVYLAKKDQDSLARARLIADAMVYATAHDRFYQDGRLRNAYTASDLALPPGWKPNGKPDTVRIPGFWKPGDNEWREDLVQVSTYAGNVAWAMIALATAYEQFKDPRYLRTAEALGEWVERHCRDERPRGGYTGGDEGWEPDARKLRYKSTEHNIDLYAAFERLAVITGEKKWHERATHAEQFVAAMWDAEKGCFCTGTKDEDDGTPATLNMDVIPLDIHAWAILALHNPEQQKKYAPGLAYVERHHAIDGGFDFDTKGLRAETPDGIWYEGTAQVALAYRTLGNRERADALLGVIERAQLQSGAIPAASKDDGVTTGFGVPGLPGEDPIPWLYYKRGHVGATAWYLFAKMGVNPYWLHEPAG